MCNSTSDEYLFIFSRHGELDFIFELISALNRQIKTLSVAFPLRVWSLRVSTQILGQLRVTSTQFQEKYPYIASTGNGSLTLKLNNSGSVLKFWAS